MKMKKDGEYLAPQIKVIEIKSHGMICLSGGLDALLIDEMDFGEDIFGDNLDLWI